MKIVLQMFEYLKKIRSETKYKRRDGRQINAEYELRLIAFFGSGFHNGIVVIKLSHWCTIFNPVKMTRGLTTLKNFNGVSDAKQKYKGRPQFTNVLWSMNHLKVLWKRLGKKFCFEEKFSIFETDHENTWEDLREQRMSYVKNDVLAFFIRLCKIQNAFDQINWIWKEKICHISLLYVGDFLFQRG